MLDMEKVIKALECRKNAHKRCGNPCEETGSCHYATAVRDINGEIYRPFICDRERICTDARDLLKEQEPIPCGEKIKSGDIVLDFYECGYCKNAIRKPWRYCPFCGKAVKWSA